MPDFEITQAFWQIFSPTDPVLRVRFIHPDRRAYEREGTLRLLWDDVRHFQGHGYGVFYFLNAVRQGPGSGAGGCATDKDVTGVRVVAIDCDEGFPARYHSPPDIVVYTSPGRGQAIWHIWGCPLSQFRRIQQRLAEHYRSDPSVVNLSRVFRLPGTLNTKYPDQPVVTFSTKQSLR